MAIAVTVYSLLDDLFSLSPDQLDSEIQELEKRLGLLRMVRRYVVTPEDKRDPADVMPYIEPPRKRNRVKRQDLTPEEIKSASEQTLACLMANGPLSWRELLRHSKLNPKSLARGLGELNAMKRDDGRYEVAT